MLFVIGLTGLAGSGKGEVSKYLASEYDFKKLVFSDVVRDEAKTRGLLNSNQNYEEQKYVLSKLGEAMRRESGRMGILAEKLVEKIKNGDYERAVVDGFRSVEEVNLFRGSFDKFYLVLVDADANIRFSRRKNQDPSTTVEAFSKRDRENIEVMGLGKTIEMADLTIRNNENDITKLHSDVDSVMGNLGIRKPSQ